MRATEKSREKDVGRLDEAIAHVIAIIKADLPKTGDPEEDAVNAVAFSRVKLDACRALVPLLERNAALLGLDAPTGKNTTNAQPAGSLAELEKKLALVRSG